jgi:hypothetical protein
VPLPLELPGSLFQTLSSDVVLVVPPQPTTNGLEDGRSTLAGVGPPSEASLSPDAANTIMPALVAACAAAFNWPA